ncbi:MAG: hypothetical protein ACKVZH_05850 [Blastocatellia bacterium]
MVTDNLNQMPETIRITLQVTGLLEKLGTPYLIGGSVASIVHGETRLTNDLDLVADLSENQIAAMVEALEAEFYVDNQAIQRAIRERSSFNLIHLATMFKVDVFIHRRDEWAREQMRRSVSKSLLEGDDSTMRQVSSAETMILQKLLWFRKGGEVSDRQWRDVLGMLKVQAERLDFDYLRQWAVALQISDLLEKSLQESGKRQ